MSEIKFIDVKGARTRYLEAGAGEPLLLIHGGHFGFTFNAEDWDTVIDGLASHFHVYAIDKLGSGFTDNPQSDDDYVIGSTVRHAHDFLDAMSIKSAHVAGHSRGGYVATRMALEYPGVVKTLINISSATLMGIEPPEYGKWAKEISTMENVHDRIHYFAAENSFNPDHIDNRFLEVGAELDALDKIQEANEKMAGDLFQQFSEDLEVVTRDSRERIEAGEMKVPTLVVWGYDDPSAKFDPIGILAIKLILSSVPRSEALVLAQAGHYCYREQPESFIDAVTRFIQKVK